MQIFIIEGEKIRRKGVAGEWTLYRYNSIHRYHNLTGPLSPGNLFANGDNTNLHVTAIVIIETKIVTKCYH